MYHRHCVTNQGIRHLFKQQLSRGPIVCVCFFVLVPSLQVHNYYEALTFFQLNFNESLCNCVN